MSTHEIQHLIFHQGQFIFQDGKQDEGMIISRYNIPSAQIEYYFIPSTNILAYQATKSRIGMDYNSLQKLGQVIDIASIQHAKMIN